MHRNLLAMALLGALANMPIAQAQESHAALHADAMPATTLDGIVVVGVAPAMATTFITDPKGPLFTDAGPFSELGAALAKAAYESVTECLVKYDHPWNASPLLQTPDAVDLNKLKNTPPKEN